jgi:hypothetical protein
MDSILARYRRVAWLCAAALFGQSGGRFEEAKRLGIAYIQSEQFDKAAGRLEEVWEQDRSDPSVGEYLAVAYLNTENRKALPASAKQAFAIIRDLTSAGSRVTFLVQHSHEKLGWLQGRELNQYCRGRLSVSIGHLTFVAEKGEKVTHHSFDVTRVSEISLNDGDVRGTFQLKTPSGSYFMATRNRNPEEARVLVQVIRDHFKLK